MQSKSMLDGRHKLSKANPTAVRDGAGVWPHFAPLVVKVSNFGTDQGNSKDSE